MIILGSTQFGNSRRGRPSVGRFVLPAVCLWASPLAVAQMPVTKVVVVEARSMDAPSTLTVVGTVEPFRRSRVSSEIAGHVEQMPGREGDLINEGGVICQLDDATFRFRVEEERAELASLQARHDELLAGTREEELARLKALFDESTAVFDRWAFEMERVQNLYADHESNKKEYYDTRAEYLAAERRKIAAEAAYNLGVEGPRKETILQAASAVAKQKAVVDRAVDELSKTTIRAPFTGHVVQRMVEVGEWLSVGDAVVEMVDLSSVLVRVHVPEFALPFLAVDDAARVRIDALKRFFDGRIKRVMLQADPNARTFPIEVEVDNAERLIAGGMFARVTVPAGPKAKVVAVPKDAIVERDGTAYLAKLSQARSGDPVGILMPVTLGADIGDWIAITSNNLDAGTPVITRGTERILPFPTPVEVVDAKGTPVDLPLRNSASTSKDRT